MVGQLLVPAALPPGGWEGLGDRSGRVRKIFPSTWVRIPDCEACGELKQPVYKCRAVNVLLTLGVRGVKTAELQAAV